MGAKFAPCMRKDSRVEAEVLDPIREREASTSTDYGCCMPVDGCFSTYRDNCTATVTPALSNANAARAYTEPIVVIVCAGQAVRRRAVLPGLCRRRGLRDLSQCGGFFISRFRLGKPITPPLTHTHTHTHRLQQARGDQHAGQHVQVHADRAAVLSRARWQL